MKLVGISGVARSGKDTFASALINVIEDFCPHFSVKKYAFADKLKEELDSFFLERFGFPSSAIPDNKKHQVRPLLVAYGQVQRSLTNNLYWRDHVASLVERDQPDVAIISDLRYAHGDNSESEWIKSMGGKTVYIQRFEIVQKNGKKCKKYMKPASNDEEIQDPYLRDTADFIIDWESFYNKDLKKESVRYATDFYLQNINFFLK